MPEDIEDELFQFKYRSHFGLTVEEYRNEPWTALYQARLIWAFEEERAKLESKKRHA